MDFKEPKIVLIKNNYKQKENFEIHQTFYLKNKYDLERFKSICFTLNVKPLFVTDITTGGILNDLMTSFKVCDTFEACLLKIENIQNHFCENGFKVFRTKIESSPNFNIEDNFVNYLESHLQIEMNENDFLKNELLKKLCYEKKFHLSKNAFKNIENGNYIVMATYREKEDCNIEKFSKTTLDFKKTLEDNGIFVKEKIEIEKVIFDDKEEHDKKWLSN